jgi:hypothetical protein
MIVLGVGKKISLFPYFQEHFENFILFLKINSCVNVKNIFAKIFSKHQDLGENLWQKWENLDHFYKFYKIEKIVLENITSSLPRQCKLFAEMKIFRKKAFIAKDSQKVFVHDKTLTFS